MFYLDQIIACVHQDSYDGMKEKNSISLWDDIWLPQFCASWGYWRHNAAIDKNGVRLVPTVRLLIEGGWRARGDESNSKGQGVMILNTHFPEQSGVPPLSTKLHVLPSLGLKLQLHFQNFV
jgi:hypothetical protein